MACTPRLSRNPLSGSIIEVTIDLQSLSHIGSSKTLLARYHEPHAPIVARTNHHIPHTTVLCDKPASKSRRFATVCELRSLSRIASSTFLLAIQPISRTARTNFCTQSSHPSTDRAVRQAMETNPPSDDLAATIGHGNEVSGLKNYGRKASGEDLNEYGGEASGEEASLQKSKPKPKPKRVYNTVGFLKKKRCLIRHKKEKQKQTTYGFSASRAAIGIPNTNAQQISSDLVGDHKLRDIHRIPTKENVKRGRSSLKMAFDNLQRSHEYRESRVKKLMAEKRFILARINDEKK